MSKDDESPDLATNFDRMHKGRLESSTLERLWKAAYGDDYPDMVRPNAFYSLTTLRRLEDAFDLKADDTLVDLGCGDGGAGLWLARQFGANLIGIDLSPGGVALAEGRAADLGLRDKSRFQAGDMMATGLPDASCDGAISLDVLLFVTDKAAAIRETARILRPGGRFAFTTWEQAGYSARLGADQLEDHRPLLEASGFDIEIYEEPPDWRRQQHAMLSSAVAHERELGEEMGQVAASRFVGMARGALDEMPSRRYVLGVGCRR